MARSGEKGGTLYEDVLEFARREIEGASSKISELRQTLQLLDARVEAAKSVYEAVAARLNLEDELGEEVGFQEDRYPVASPPQQVPEPPEEPVEVREEVGENGNKPEFSADLIRRHLEQRAAKVKSAEKQLAEPEPVPSPASVRDETEGGADGDGRSEGGVESGMEASRGLKGLSDADRQLIEEHMRRRAGAK